MRSLLALIPIGFAVSGCLPPIIVVANYASDGILLAATGKTKTEHFISGWAKKDCSTFRVVQGKEVCQEWKEGHEQPEVALGPGSDVVPPPQGRERNAVNNSNIAKAPAQPVTTTANLPQQNTANGARSDVAAPAKIDPPAAAQPVATPVAAPVTAPIATVEPPKPAPQQMPVAQKPIASAPKPQPPAPAPTANNSPDVAEIRVLDYIVVLGVVRAESGGLSIARRYRDIAADVRLEQVDARHWRVVSGPYVEYEAFNMRDTLRDHGLASANVAPCTGKCLANGQAVRPVETKPAVKKPGPQARRAPPTKPTKTEIAVNQ